MILSYIVMVHKILSCLFLFYFDVFDSWGLQGQCKDSKDPTPLWQGAVSSSGPAPQQPKSKLQKTRSTWSPVQVAQAHAIETLENIAHLFASFNFIQIYSSSLMFCYVHKTHSATQVAVEPSPLCRHLVAMLLNLRASVAAPNLSILLAFKNLFASHAHSRFSLSQNDKCIWCIFRISYCILAMINYGCGCDRPSASSHSLALAAALSPLAPWCEPW